MAGDKERLKRRIKRLVAERDAALARVAELEAASADDRPTVTLRFASKAKKESFMSGLSDGFGENSCLLDWPWRSGMKFDECRLFDVTPIDEDGYAD